MNLLCVTQKLDHSLKKCIGPTTLDYFRPRRRTRQNDVLIIIWILMLKTLITNQHLFLRYNFYISKCTFEQHHAGYHLIIVSKDYMTVECVESRNKSVNEVIGWYLLNLFIAWVPILQKKQEYGFILYHLFVFIFLGSS